MRKFLADTISDRFPVDRTDPRHIEWFLDEAAKNDTAYIARFVGLMASLEWSDQLHRIKCPTLVVYPGAETVGSTHNYDAMRDRIPGRRDDLLRGPAAQHLRQRAGPLRRRRAEVSGETLRQAVLSSFRFAMPERLKSRMFVTFFTELKSAGVPVTLREYLTLMEAMEKDLAGRRVEDFYYLSRATLVKDERNLDKFDRVFGHVFKGLDLLEQALTAEIPAEWLKKLAEKYLTEEEKKMIEAMGGLDKLLETLKKRLEEQKGRHQGGKKWIGTAGTSPFGAYGYNPEGIRIGQDEATATSAP